MELGNGLVNIMNSYFILSPAICLTVEIQRHSAMEFGNGLVNIMNSYLILFPARPSAWQREFSDIDINNILNFGNNIVRHLEIFSSNSEYSWIFLRWRLKKYYGSALVHIRWSKSMWIFMHLEVFSSLNLGIQKKILQLGTCNNIGHFSK